jgi:TolA-binding protein
LQSARTAVQAQAEYALFHWAQALATDAKQLDKAKALLERHAREYPRSPLRPRVLLLLAMIEAGNGPSHQSAALKLLGELVTQYPAAPQAPEALWKTAIIHATNGRRDEASAAFQALAAKYPASPRAKHVAGWLEYLKKH